MKTIRTGYIGYVATIDQKPGQYSEIAAFQNNSYKIPNFWKTTKTML